MKIKYTITGIDCPNCAAKLAASMEKIDGVESAKINFLTEKLTVEATIAEDVLLPLLEKCAAAFDDDVEIG